MARSGGYEIDGKAVSREEFDRFLATLHGQTGWVCEKTQTGGVEIHRAQDASGQWYVVYQVSDWTGQDPSIIRKIANPHEW